MSIFGFLKKLSLFVLIVAIAIPIRYGSTDPTYLLVRVIHSMLSLKNSILSDPARSMLSADYRAWEDMLRSNPVPKPDPLADPFTIIKELRSNFGFGTIIPKPSQCKINKEVFEHDGHTVDAYWVDNHQKSLQRESNIILLYFHGGGYLMGDIHGYGGFECHLSRLFNVTLLHLEYRLSPEHPLPAAVDDAVAIYRALLRKNISPSQLMIMGDSAGGGLSLLTIQALIARQLPVPRGVIVLSPWADLTASGESHTRNNLTDVMVNSELSKWMAAQVLGSIQSQLLPNNPTFSPLFGSFEGFPPMYITVGTAEILEDDSRLVAKKAQEAGVDVTFEVGLHLLHVYPIFFPYYPEARNTLDNINQWVQKVFYEKNRE